MPSMCLPCNIEYLSIIESGISNQATAPFVLKKTYLTQYTQLRYVAFIGNGYSWRFDPSIHKCAPANAADYRGQKKTRHK